MRVAVWITLIGLLAVSALAPARSATPAVLASPVPAMALDTGSITGCAAAPSTSCSTDPFYATSRVRVQIVPLVVGTITVHLWRYSQAVSTWTCSGSAVDAVASCSGAPPASISRGTFKITGTADAGTAGAYGIYYDYD